MRNCTICGKMRLGVTVNGKHDVPFIMTPPGQKRTKNLIWFHDSFSIYTGITEDLSRRVLFTAAL